MRETINSIKDNIKTGDTERALNDFFEYLNSEFNPYENDFIDELQNGIIVLQAKYSTYKKQMILGTIESNSLLIPNQINVSILSLLKDFDKYLVKLQFQKNIESKTIKGNQSDPLFGIFIDKESIIGKNVYIAPNAFIEKNVTIGDNCWIGPNVSIMNGTIIGSGCKIFGNTVLCAIPQGINMSEVHRLEIGDNVTIRENCTISGSTEMLGKSIIKNNVVIMGAVHIAHGCVIEDNCVIANSVFFAGHTIVEKYATIGAMTAVHQFIRIGTQSMIAGGSNVRKDIPPYITAARDPLSYFGVNTIGLRRRKFSNEDIQHIEEIYKIIFDQSRSKSEKEELLLIIPNTKFKKEIIDFMKYSDRGTVDGFSKFEQQ